MSAGEGSCEYGISSKPWYDRDLLTVVSLR